MDENNQKLLKLRQKIDIIDTKLIELIEDRSNLAKEIIKAKSGENIFKPEREEALIKDIIKQSNSSNPEFIERVWRLLISENLFLQGGLRISVGSSMDAYKSACWHFGRSAKILIEKNNEEAFKKIIAENYDAAVVLKTSELKDEYFIDGKIIKKFASSPITDQDKLAKIAIFKKKRILRGVKLKEVKTKKSLLNLQSYRPAVAESKSSEIIRLSVNEGALGPSPKACLAIKNWSKQKHLFHRYPDQIDQNLIKAIASRYGLKKEKIVLGNGSDDLIQLICNTYLDPGDEAIYTEYGFLVFPQSIRIAGGKPIMAKDVNYTASLDNILSKISKKTKIIFLANPNNPTGTMVGRNEISNFIKKVRSNILIILDAAYAEYVDKIEYSNGLEFVEKLNNVIMLRTFSKLHALASLRLGWAYCPEKIANILKSVRPAFSVNSLASFAGAAAVEDIEFPEIIIFSQSQN